MSMCDIRSESGQCLAARQCVILRGESGWLAGNQCVRLKVRVVSDVQHMSVYEITCSHICCHRQYFHDAMYGSSNIPMFGRTLLVLHSTFKMDAALQQQQ